MGKLYSLILGQCTKGLKAKLKGLSTFKMIDGTNDAIGLLRAINEITFKFKAHDNIHVSLWNIKRQVANMFQNGMNLTQFMDKFSVNDTITNKTGCSIWVDSKTVQEELQLLNSSA